MNSVCVKRLNWSFFRGQVLDVFAAALAALFFSAFALGFQIRNPHLPPAKTLTSLSCQVSLPLDVSIYVFMFGC